MVDLFGVMLIVEKVGLMIFFIVQVYHNVNEMSRVLVVKKWQDLQKFISKIVEMNKDLVLNDKTGKNVL